MKYKTLFRKLAKSKKGFDDDFVDIIIGIIFIALIFIVVFVYITNTQVRIEKAIEKESNNLEKDYILLSYLRTPMEGKGITIVEYLGSLNKDKIRKECTKKGLLTAETQDILKGITDWRMSMHINKEEVCSIAKGEGTEQFIIGETSATLLPSADLDSDIKIYFKFKVSSYILPP